jgi:hypothetical protein
MKLLKYIKCTCVLVLSFVSSVYALDTFGETEDNVVVNAMVTEDSNSTLSVLPSSVEIKEIATVIVTIKDSNSNPVEGHYIQLVAPGLVFTQPTDPSDAQGKITVPVYSNNSGTYNICTQDITYENIVINILDCDTLYVAPVETPLLLEEPQYTKGTTNSLFWNSVGSNYKYKIESGTKEDFSTVYSSSDWISGTMFEFVDLENEVMYFYRVKARNSYGGESSWSNVRYSVQDDESPVIMILSVSDVGDNNNIEWDASYKIKVVYKVTDNLSLKSSEFICLDNQGESYSCGNVQQTGILYTATIPLSELKRDGINNLFTSYKFCVNAEDEAGNKSQNCNITLQIPEWEEEEEEAPPKVPISVGRIIRDLIDNTEIIMDDMFGDLDTYTLQDISTTSTIATIVVGFGALLEGLIYIPMYLFEGLLSLLSWLGLRKKGKLSGYVYDSNTKEPISQAVIRVYSADSKLVWTDVTDSRGFFRLAVEDGKYTIKVVARGYEFPSKVIFGKSDYPLENVYHGEEFTVSKGIMPEFSIPLDSIEMNWFERGMAVLRGRLRILYKVFSLLFFVFGLIFTVYTYNMNPNWFNFVMILLYIPSFVLIVRAVFKKQLEYGVIKNEKGEVLGNIAVGLRDIEYGRIIAKRNTDGKGRYRFIVDEGEYELEILDPEYEVVSIEEEEPRKLPDDSVLIALDTVLKPIKVEK